MQRLHVGNVSGKDGLSARLERIASDKGFVISDNEGSGNCMFHALCEQLHLVKGITISHEKLRHSIVQYLRKNPKLVGEVFCFGVVIELFFLQKKYLLVSMSGYVMDGSMDE